MLNRVEIIGNVGRDPEMRYTPNGTAVAGFSVAVNDKRGEEETTEWFNVVCWNKTAEFCNQYLNKGRQVYVEGKQHTNIWEDEAGKHYRTELNASRVLLLGNKPKENNEEELSF
jgi:single-strand DNA-binding protein